MPNYRKPEVYHNIRVACEIWDKGGTNKEVSEATGMSMRWTESVKPEKYKVSIAKDRSRKRKEAIRLFTKGSYCAEVARQTGFSESTCRNIRNELGIKSPFSHSGNNIKPTTEEYKAKVYNVHGDSITVLEQYVDHRTPIGHKCNKCGNVWKTTPDIIVNSGCGCPKCVTFRYSLKAIDWLEHQSKLRRRVIQHAENGGEYFIKQLGIFVDGINHRSRTVFEFLGSPFHGDPNIYGPRDKPNFYRKGTTALALQKETVERFSRLRKEGYTVIYIYESEWLEGKDAHVYRNRTQILGR